MHCNPKQKQFHIFLSNILISFMLLSVPIKSKNILVISPTSSRSHFNFFAAVVGVLAEEHNVTFYSVYKPKDHKNITFRQMYNPYIKAKYAERNTISKMIYNTHPIDQWLYVLQRTSTSHFEQMFNGSGFIELINSTEQYDLLLTLNYLGEVFYKFAEVFNAPLIQIATTVVPPWTNAAIKNSFSLSNDLSLFATELSDNFFNRLTLYLQQLYVWCQYEWIFLPKIEAITNRYFPRETPTIKDIAARTEGLIINSVSAMGYSRAAAANVIEIGGLHCRPANKLPEDLEHFMTNSKNGIIYFSLGSTWSDLLIPQNTREIFRNVFAKLPYNILWKTEDNIQNLPKNIKTAKWFPQQDILGHNNTKLFIMQGGLLSLQEAVYHGIPVLILPQFFDQFINSHIAERINYARNLLFKDFNEENLHKNIEEMINNRRYAKKIKQLSNAVRDPFVNNTKRFQQWINYIIRHKNISPFRPVTPDLSVIQILEIDIIITIFVICILICFTLKYICCLWISFIQKSVFKTKLKSQ